MTLIHAYIHTYIHILLANAASYQNNNNDSNLKANRALILAKAIGKISVSADVKIQFISSTSLVLTKKLDKNKNNQCPVVHRCERRRGEVQRLEENRRWFHACGCRPVASTVRETDCRGGVTGRRDRKAEEVIKKREKKASCQVFIIWKHFLAAGKKTGNL